ncbi:hypothetical protein FVE85_9063 [Porphyridium purpureum]|uniref:F-box domain-containing protein n=1 Tax=Porphyridium purpureum TaxID=35688 RepID=A0A5J4YMR8_PORPP|nr:hypothetical protein FVE85_9063 [Porphyridium purpureum]|eukprot:POR7242..scf222_8
MPDVGEAEGRLQGSHDDTERAAAGRAATAAHAQVSWAQLPEEVLVQVFAACGPDVEAFALRTAALVCKAWHAASRSNLLWKELCAKLWSDKVYIKDAIRGRPPMDAYRESLADSKREYLELDELVGFEWSFRFKAAAGEHWVETDPWWQEDGEAVRVKFGRDGRVMGRGQVHVTQQFRWRFVESSCGMVRRKGSFIRVNEFPCYIVSRHPNWGFILQSCWVLHTSFPMPHRGTDAFLEDENLTVTVEQQKDEANEYNARVTRYFFNFFGEGVDPEDRAGLVEQFLDSEEEDILNDFVQGSSDEYD